MLSAALNMGTPFPRSIDLGIFRAINNDPNLKKGAIKEIFSAIWINRYKDEMRCFAVEYLCKATNYCSRTVRNRLAELEKKKYISISRTKNNFGGDGPNRINICVNYNEQRGFYEMNREVKDKLKIMPDDFNLLAAECIRDRAEHKPNNFEGGTFLSENIIQSENPIISRVEKNAPTYASRLDLVKKNCISTKPENSSSSMALSFPLKKIKEKNARPSRPSHVKHVRSKQNCLLLKWGIIVNQIAKAWNSSNLIVQFVGTESQRYAVAQILESGVNASDLLQAIERKHELGNDCYMVHRFDLTGFLGCYRKDGKAPAYLQFTGEDYDPVNVMSKKAIEREKTKKRDEELLKVLSDAKKSEERVLRSFAVENPAPHEKTLDENTLSEAIKNIRLKMFSVF